MILTNEKEMPVYRNKLNTSLIRVIFPIFILLLMIFSCSKSDDGDVSSSGQAEAPVEVQMDLTISSFKKLETATTSERQSSFIADQIMEGQLTTVNIDTSVTSTFDWTIYLDETAWEVQSNKTIVLPPGEYEFNLLLTRGGQQYAGSVVYEVIDGTNDIPLTIRPIIGNTIADVILVGELSDFRFQYNPDEISTAGLTDPRIGIIVDSGNEEIFSINPQTGVTDSYVRLDTGAHSIRLKLYDGGIQRGRSIAEQEAVLIAPGLDISMDLVPLQGETILSLSEEGGDATFNFNIPDEVVDEAGGAQNLEVQFSLVGTRNALHENILNLTSLPSGDYEASITLSGMHVDLVTISLAFRDISSSPGELLGSCNLEATLDSVQRLANCDMTLRRRAVVSGSLLATVGINVLNSLKQPISGAAVTEDGAILGISGSGMFGSTGYLKLYMNAGSHILKAETATQAGINMATLVPLSVKNMDIIIENRPSFTKVIYEKEVSSGSEIFLMDADGLNQTRLTWTAENADGQNLNTTPQYSMYLDQILFVSNRNGSYEWSDLFVMQKDGTGVTPLTTDNQKHNHFALSLDGFIYYSHWATNTDLYFMNLDGSGKTPLSWSSAPDVLVWDVSINNQLLYSDNDILHRIDTWGTGDVIVGEKTGDLVFHGASWSPDGTRVLAGRHDATTHQLWIMDADGTNRVLIDLGSLELDTGQPRFSPDGAQILFSAAEPGQAYDIYVANVDGSGITNLTNTPVDNEKQPFPY